MCTTGSIFRILTNKQKKGFLFGYSAGLHLVFYSSLIVATFLDEPAGKTKINEAYPRSEITKPNVKRR